jgi:hypothetical protein
MIDNDNDNDGNATVAERLVVLSEERNNPAIWACL